MRILIYLFFFSFIASAEQRAFVNVDRAIVYADMQRATPIGIIRRGREILVGEKLREQGSVLPIIVSGKIAWIGVTDLQFPEQGDVTISDAREYNKEKFYQQENVNLDEKAALKSLSISYGLYSAGSEYSDAQDGISQTSGASSMGESFRLSYKDPSSTPPFYTRWAYEYFLVTDTNFEILGHTAIYGKGLRAFSGESWYFDFDLAAKLASVSQDSTSESISGFFLGAEAHADLGYRLTRSLAIDISYSLQYLMDLNSDDFKSTNSYLVSNPVPVEKIVGHVLHLQLSYIF